MRVFILPMIVIVLFLLAYLLVTLVRAGRGPTPVEARPRWEVDTVMRDGRTLVIVRKVVRGRRGPVELTKQIVSAIPDDAPDWDERYRAAMAEARSRVSTLELEAD